MPFVVPTLVWSAFNHQGGIDISKAIVAAKTCQDHLNVKSKQEKEDILSFICENLNNVKFEKHNYFNRQSFVSQPRRRRRRQSRGCLFCFASMNTSYIADLLLSVKILYILAIPFNCLLNSLFLNTNFFMLGLKFFYRLVTYKDLSFPVIRPHYLFFYFLLSLFCALILEIVAKPLKWIS